MRERPYPVPLHDIRGAADVHDLVVEFYREVVFDELLEPVFGEVAEVDWAEHIPKLIDYWSWIILGTGRPTGSIMASHRHLHATSPITPELCDRWYSLWSESIDSRWIGPRSERARSHAASIMSGMAKRVFGFEWTPPAVVGRQPATPIGR